MLTVAALLEELQLVPPDSPVEVWYQPDVAGGTYDVDVDVTLQVVHDHAQQPIGLAVIAARPRCERTHPIRPVRADVELTDVTGHRHPLCATHVGVALLEDRRARLTAVYGGAGAVGWSIAADLLVARWPDEPDITAWASHPARWRLPIPHQPITTEAVR